MISYYYFFLKKIFFSLLPLLPIHVERWRQGWSWYERGSGMAERIHRKRYHNKTENYNWEREKKQKKYPKSGGCINFFLVLLFYYRNCCIHSWWRHPNKSSGSGPKLCEYKRNYFSFVRSFVLDLHRWDGIFRFFFSQFFFQFYTYFCISSL